MKNFIKTCLVTYALIILGVFSIPILLNWNFEYFDPIYLQLLIATVTIHLVQLATPQIKCRNRWAEIAIELSMVLAVVLGYSMLFGWYMGRVSWVLVVIVVAVYAVYYLLNYTKAKKDIDFINERIKSRKQREV
jgi:Ca2+/Na+ antiporter